MRNKTPSSHSRFLSRAAPYDLLCAVASPFLAFLVRDGTIYRIESVAIYCGIALCASLVAFQWFKISSPIASFFSAHDAFAVVQACLTTVALTTAVLFTFTRLEEAPRSIPFIHFFILTSGLVGQRAISRLFETWRAGNLNGPPSHELENIVVIGATRASWLFSKMVDELAFNETRIVAFLDDRPNLRSRLINGYMVVGSPARLSEVIDEYATHGVEIGKIVLATEQGEMSAAMLTDIRAICGAKNIQVEWLGDLVRFARSTEISPKVITAANDAGAYLPARPYWKIKRMMDFALAALALIVFLPLVLIVAVLILVDVGYPVVFWQFRIGHLGRRFQIYKFRTMRPVYDREGRPIPEAQRLSAFGRLARRNRIDEIPQLFNILNGSMSFVGPRPLLPSDQPADFRLRLRVKPGLTGLAQVHGGKLLSPEEKDALDESYVKRASLWLDLKIMMRTLWVIVHGDRRDETEISTARSERQMRTALGA